MKVSKVANSIEPSLTRKLFNMAKAYDDVIDLTLGDPDVPPLESIRQAACDAIMAGKLRYSANAGLPMLRDVIAKNYKRETGIEIDSTKNVAVTVGGMEALYLTFMAMIDEGDEVIIFAPYYVNYKQMIQMCGGIPVVIDTKEENDFIPKIEDIEKYITDKTIAIVINTPCNPTGAVYDKNSLEEIAELCKKRNLAVISDEVYCQMVYKGYKHESIALFPDMQERTIVVDSFSKRFAMTGYRIGYIIANEELITGIVKLQENVAACAPVSSQYAAINAFEECINDNSMQIEFEKRRDYIYPAIKNIEGLSCAKPSATFYLFVNVKGTGLSGLDFAYKLLEKEHVAVVPGITYGENYGDYIRIAYTMNIDKLKLAVERIERFVSSLKNM